MPGAIARNGSSTPAGLGGSARITLWAHAWLARVQFATGEWDRALQTVELGRALTASSGIVLAEPLLEWTAAQVHALRGNWAAADAAVRNAEAVTQDYEIMRIPTLLGKAQIAEAEADYAISRLDLAPSTSSRMSCSQPRAIVTRCAWAPCRTQLASSSYAAVAWRD